MNKITMIIFLLLSISMNSQTFINKELNGEINLELNTLSIELNEILFSGDLVPIDYKYKKYYIVKGENHQLLISFENLKSKSQTKISEILILDGEYEKLVKDIKDRLLSDNNISFKYNYMFDASKHKDLNSMWINKEYLKVQNELKEKYITVSDLENFKGKYYVKILTSGSLNYSELEYKAELYISDIGFSFKSEIPSIMLLRGTHYINEDFLPTKKGTFILTKAGSNSVLVSLSINSEKKSGAFSIIEYGTTNTTTFVIEKFVN